MRIQITMSLPREAASVPLARRTVATALHSAGVEDDCVSDVEVAISEACTNVYNHAGEGADYEVAINISDEQLTIGVLDSRAGFGHRPTWPAATMPDGHAENGRGLALMTALTDHANFDSVNADGGAVHLTKKLRWNARAPLPPPT